MKKRSGFRVMLCLIGLVRPLTGYMLLAIALGLAGHLAATFLTILGGYAAVQLLGYSTPLSLRGIFVSVCVLALLRGVLRYGEQACNHFIAFRLLALLRERVFRALRRLCPAKLEGKAKGDLIAILTSDIELLEVFYAHTISPIAIAACFSAILCAFIGSFHLLLGWIALAAYVTVGVCIPIITSMCSGEVGLRCRKSSGAFSGFLLDSLRGLSELLQYGQGAKRLTQMQERMDALAEEEWQLKRTAGRNQAVTNSVILLFDLLLFVAAAGLYERGQVSFPAVLLATIALMSSFGPTVALANLGSTLQQTFAAGNRVLELLDETPQVAEITGKAPVTFDGARVLDVSFSYGEEQILDHVSMEILQGKIVGISGKSGSGKSTLLKLLMRFWETTSGSVEISGVSVNEIDTSNLRAMESYVTQETHLFCDSIRNNLRIAKPDATEEELYAACKKASVHAFIMGLPQGYDTPVGELGDTLSGGERQRLGVARAFLHDAQLLLLDEPTSNLDSLNEAVILKALREEKENKTIVLVSHRASTLRIADQTYALEQGRMS